MSRLTKEQWLFLCFSTATSAPKGKPVSISSVEKTFIQNIGGRLSGRLSRNTVHTYEVERAMDIIKRHHYIHIASEKIMHFVAQLRDDVYGETIIDDLYYLGADYHYPYALCRHLVERDSTMDYIPQSLTELYQYGFFLLQWMALNGPRFTDKQLSAMGCYVGEDEAESFTVQYPRMYLPLRNLSKEDPFNVRLRGNCSHLYGLKCTLLQLALTQTALRGYMQYGRRDVLAAVFKQFPEESPYTRHISSKPKFKWGWTHMLSLIAHDPTTEEGVEKMIDACYKAIDEGSQLSRPHILVSNSKVTQNDHTMPFVNVHLDRNDVSITLIKTRKKGE